MRLIHFVFNENRHPTAMSDALATIGERALERGWRFQVVAPEATRDSSWAAGLIERGAELEYLQRGGRRQLTIGIAAILASSPDATLLHTHLTGYDVPAALAARRHGRAGLFWHVHSFLPSGFKAAARLRLKHLLFKGSVDRVVAQSDNIRDGLLRGGISAERIVMFASGIEPDHYPLRTDEVRAAEREEMGLSDSDQLLLHFGWHAQIKGTDRFLGALRILADEGRPVIGLINRAADEARRDIKRLELSSFVRFGGLVEDTHPLYAAADCMVAPSRGEGMPFSLVEALATGLPVVASDLPGHRYLADHMPACTIADSEPEALAAAIRATLDRDRERRQADALESRRWIVENLNVDKVVDDLFVAYDQALAERGLNT